MKKRSSLRVQLITILLLFVVAILGFVYLFQTTFLDSFYKRNKINTLQSVGRSVSDLIGQSDLDELLDQIGMSNEVCVRVVSNNDEYNYVGACTLRNLDPNVINMIASETVNNGNEKMFDNFRYQRRFDDAPEEVYIYSRFMNYNDSDIMVLVSSGITPLNVTISTIKSQYIVIVAVVILMTLVLALLISQFILKPIKQISDESVRLSKGEYDGSLVNAGSREFEDLNSNLIQANEDILKADKAKKELLGNVSHDLRTPLTMIVGYGEMIRDLPEENNEDNINVIINEAKRLSTLVDDLIDISKIESTGVELELKETDVRELLEDVYHQYEKYCEAQGIKLTLNIDEDIRTDMDERRIKQVLYNFINNSLNYNSKDHQEIELGVKKNEDKYRIYVHDNGDGIDEKDLKNVWDRYYKVDKEHKRHHIGSGIGLSLARELLNRHGFAYGVDSKKDEYTCFYFDVTAK